MWGSFDETELKAKGNLPDVDYEGVNKGKRVTNKELNDCDERLSPRDKFWVEILYSSNECLWNHWRQDPLYMIMLHGFKFLVY